MKFLILNGPNINMLGIREPHIYGTATYDDLVLTVQRHAEALGVAVEFVVSNHEGELVDAIQKAFFTHVDGIVCNPAAYTHTSVAIADAVKAVGIPTVEVHISDVNAREEFRRISYIRSCAIECISGKGLAGYTLAMDALCAYLEREHES